MASSAPSSRPVWSGSISFGLVTIPVKLFTAVREKRIGFRSLHDQDKVPLKQKLVCPADGKEVHPEHIVKGFEIEKDRYVVVRQEEIDAVAPKATRAIEILDFVGLGEIDPVYFDRGYYVAPKPEGARPYRLLLEALTKKQKVGIAKIVMHGKEYLAALRPVEDVLCMETMHFGDEVVPAEKMAAAETKAKVDARELKIAEQLIDSLTTEFKPGAYHDDYRDKVMALIDKKARGEKIVLRPEADATPPKGRDLIAALEASLQKAKGSQAGSHPGHNGHARGNGRRRKSA
ncbi:MAG: Ku protein [Phycisphaerales bacterium]|nr:Ku protein [Phycisphaerales bacterium]